ncbi:MAG: riboflavin biosynthesis protein RibF [Candidatus Omnitrophica bacterium]|nr:riboflavin biosynthesis protein RibF [Candidatus Omnitrophota bacterium]
MKVYTQLPLKARRPVVLSIGNFDGVHRGHKKILDFLRARAKTLRGEAYVLTFSRHPAKVLHPDKRVSLLASTLHKLSLLAGSGIDGCILLPFESSFSLMSPRSFARRYLAGEFPVREVCLGSNAHFGKGRSGRAKDMKRLADEFGFGFKIVYAEKAGGRRVSSTLLRQAIEQGHFGEARRMLGRRYSIFADVIPGRRIGRKIGYPTANLNPHSEALPPTGVYLVRVGILRHPRYSLRKNFEFKEHLIKKDVPALLNLGYRPTIGPREAKYPLPEVHLINFRGHLRGKLLEVTFFKKLRQEKKFRHLDHLKNQIKKDVETADKYFRQH